jgi:hypothetical protein
MEASQNILTFSQSGDDLGACDMPLVPLYVCECPASRSCHEDMGLCVVGGKYCVVQSGSCDMQIHGKLKPSCCYIPRRRTFDSLISWHTS